MDVFRHDYISEYPDRITLADRLQRLEKDRHNR
jgi:hypothetical protein